SQQTQRVRELWNLRFVLEAARPSAESRLGNEKGPGRHRRLTWALAIERLCATCVLALENAVDLEHFGLARKLDPDVLQHRHEALTERVELLFRLPDLSDSEVAVRLESDVVLKSVRQPVAGLLQTADGFVVLF